MRALASSAPRALPLGVAVVSRNFARACSRRNGRDLLSDTGGWSAEAVWCRRPDTTILLSNTGGLAGTLGSGLWFETSRPVESVIAPRPTLPVSERAALLLQFNCVDSDLVDASVLQRVSRCPVAPQQWWHYERWVHPARIDKNRPIGVTPDEMTARTHNHHVLRKVCVQGCRVASPNDRLQHTYKVALKNDRMVIGSRYRTVQILRTLDLDHAGTR